MDAKCPANTQACSPVTTGRNTVCYPAAELAASCPITDIQFAVGNEPEYAEYEKLDYGGMKLVYTKTGADQRPITTTKVGPRPCANGAQYSRRETDAGLYYLEQDASKQACERPDDRYYMLRDFTVSEYDVQQASGVYDVLASLPGYNITDESKKATEYSFWARPTVPWSCSAV